MPFITQHFGAIAGDSVAISKEQCALDRCLLGKNWVLKTEGKNLRMEHVKALLPRPLSNRIVKEPRVVIDV